MLDNTFITINCTTIYKSISKHVVFGDVNYGPSCLLGCSIFYFSLTVQEIADVETEQLCKDFDNSGLHGVYIEPPENRSESYEDSGDKSDGLLTIR